MSFPVPSAEIPFAMATATAAAAATIPSPREKMPRYMPFDLKITLAFRFTRADGEPVESIPQTIRSTFASAYAPEHFCKHLYIDTVDYMSTEFDQDCAHMILHVGGEMEHWLDPDEYNKHMLNKWLQKNEQKTYISETGVVYMGKNVSSEIVEI